MEWRFRWLLGSAIAAGLCCGQADEVRPAPAFSAGGVLPSGGDRAIPLAPGLLITIYGDHLGPASGCEGRADTQRRETPSPLRPRQMFVETLIYPKELCETQVLVGGVPAGLLYVQQRQVNLKVPQETPIQGTAEVRVIYQGQSSLPVNLPLGLNSATVSLESPGKVGMPVWLKVSAFGWDQAIQYPFDIRPAWFNCHDVEVRLDGKPLSRIASLATQAFNGVAHSGPLCGFLGLPAESRHRGRIPLHLQYRFDRPGTYEVRYTMREGLTAEAPLIIQSTWTRIAILPGTRAERAQWLTAVSSRAPADSVELLTDFLPNVLGIPDRQSLELLCGYLYHPDGLVRQYAMYGLTYWPGQEAESAVREAVRTKGPSDAAVQFLVRRPLTVSEGDSLVEAAIPYLRSDSPVLVRGAVDAIYRTALAEKSPVSEAIRTRAEDAMIRAADPVAGLGDAQTTANYAAALGVCKDERASAVLWGFVDRDIAREQAAIALTWRRIPADLPKLAELTLAPASGQNLSAELFGLPSALHSGYGDAALPYLETMLARSELARVRTESARELMLSGRPAGFAFAVDAIENAGPSRRELIEFVRGQFPEMHQADDAGVLNFLKARATSK